MTEKQFHLKPEQIERVIEDTRMCLATDRIVVDGERVGYVYREDAAEEADSGWRFMAGDESPEYMADASNVGVYALNTLANYDPATIKLFDSPPGSAFAMGADDDEFVAVTLPDRARAERVEAEHGEGLGAPVDLLDEEEIAANRAAYPELNPEYPVSEGEYQLTSHWALTLPEPCSRRFEDGSMILWRPGLTIHIFAWDNTANDSVAERLEQLDLSIEDGATDRQQHEMPGMTRVSYRLVEEGQDSLNVFVVGEDAQLLASIYFDDKVGETQAEQVATSMRLV